MRTAVSTALIALALPMAAFAAQPLPVAITLDPAGNVPMNTTLTVHIATAPGASCIGDISRPAYVGFHSHMGPVKADDQGHATFKVFVGSTAGDRELTVTCTLKDQRGSATVGYTSP